MTEPMMAAMATPSPTNATNRPTSSGPATADDSETTAVSVWFSKAQQSKGASNRRYNIVAAWCYRESTKELTYSLWKDQGPAPYLSTLSSWISQQQPKQVLVSCGGAGKKSALEEDKNLQAWMQDIEEDLQRQARLGGRNDTVSEGEDEPSEAPSNLNFVVPSVVPPQVHKDGADILRALVQNQPSALYQLQANPDLTTTNGNSAASPLICAAGVLLQAVGLYQPNLGVNPIPNHPIQGISGATQENGDDTVGQNFTIQPAKASNFMVMDRAALGSLNVWPISHAGQAAMEGATAWHTSLWGLLAHYARTQTGKHQLQQWLLHPLIELEPLLERQATVAYLVEDNLARQGLVDQGLQPMSGTKLEKLANDLTSYQDLCDDDDDSDEEVDDAKDRSRQKLAGGTRKALQTLYQLYVLAAQKVPALDEKLQDICQSIEADQSLEKPSLLIECAKDMAAANKNLERSVGLCETILDLDQAPREYVVRKDHSDALQELAQRLEEWRRELEDCHEDMNDMWIETTSAAAPSNGNKIVRLYIPDSKSTGESSYDYQFRLPNSNDSQVLQSNKNFKKHSIKVHKVQKTGVYFSSPALKRLAKERKELDAELDTHQREVVTNAMKVAWTYGELVHAVRRSVAVLDAVSAMAQLAAYSPELYCRPSLTDSDEDGHGISLKQARHPCVERQENVHFIANDIDLKLGNKSCWLVTGPNMGGKSTFIRSIGAIVTLAQIGSFVPCQEANINIVHSIAARVGAGDLQERGISTFMSEMLEASAILKNATRRSLIVVDELGRGTSTYDGYGLARAIAGHITEKIQCLTLFATHFHELTYTLPADFPNGECHNCHVSAQTSPDSNDLVFLYKVEDGPCLESFGIPVAEMAQVPPKVIQDAKTALKRLLSTSSSGSKRERDQDRTAQDDEQRQWKAKFRKLNLPELLKKMRNGEASREAVKRAILG